MHKHLILLGIVGVLALPLYADTLLINEASLTEAAKKGSPQLDQIEAAFLNLAVEEGETREKFAPELFGRAAYLETRERAIIQFQPIFTPIKQAQIGVRKNYANGFETSAYVSTDQRTAQSNFVGKLQNVTSTTLAFTVQMDVWKNLFGKISKTDLESAEIDRKRAQIEKDIQIKTFKVSLRRVYWSLVANNESTKISEELLKTAKKQLDEAQRRFKNSVAEADEVARYEAQLASREGTILFLKYQRETLIKQLRNLLPELTKYELELGNYDVNATMNEVLACTATIGSKPDVPYENTHYDEVVSMLRKVKANNKLVDSRYSDADVKLFGTVKSTGVGSDVVNNRLTRGSYGESYDDQVRNNRTGYDVGINFTIPLGDTKENTQKVKELYNEKRLIANINATDTQVITTHHQLSKQIALLTEVIRTQKVNSEQLGKRLRLMRKKYEQARVSVDDLVNDQDALLRSELTTIDTQLQILNTIFDYLVIYTETPCAFNRI